MRSSVVTSSGNFRATPKNPFHRLGVGLGLGGHHHHHHHHHPTAANPPCSAFHSSLFPNPNPHMCQHRDQHCLDSRGLYICCAYSPRCFIIKKVTPTAQGLNPNANVFQSKLPTSPCESTTTLNWEDAGPELATAAIPLTSAAVDTSYPYMNGDISKLQPTVVFSASPEVTPPMPTEYALGDGTVVAAAAATDAALAYGTPHSPEGGGSGSTTEAPTPVSVEETGSVSEENGLPHEQLKQMLQQQLEYYFSRENLANDTYLVSQMDSDQYVPIWTVANFNKIRELTKDMTLIVQVLRESPNVQVDDAGEKVRPNHKRCIVIVREVADTTPVEEVEALFHGENCPRFVSCEFAHNNSWYVTFESDEDAQRAYRYLREEVKMFQGKPIMARIKAKPITRASFLPKNGLRPALDPSLYSPQQPPPPAPQPQPQSQPTQPPQQQQPPQQPQQQQPQQQQQRFTYQPNTMPNMGFNGQQVHVYTFPPFYPPSMLQTWAPTNPAYFDIGSVFSINGLAPQAAFKPPNGAGRHSFQMIRNRNQKGHGRGQGSMERLDSRPLHERGNHTGSGSIPVTSAMANGTGNGAAAVTATAVSALRTPRSSGIGSDGNHSRRDSGPTASTVATVAAVSPVDKKEDMTTQTASSLAYRQSEAQTLQTAQSQRSRHRRRRREEENPALKSRPDSGKPLVGKDVKPLSPKFDLEAASFPPLPGTGSLQDGTSADGDNMENCMADVVKGMSRPLMADGRTQTSAPLSPVLTRESSTFTNGDNGTVPTPPLSPTLTPFRPPKSVMTADKAMWTDDSLTNGDDHSTSGSPSGGGKPSVSSSAATAMAALGASPCLATPVSSSTSSLSSSLSTNAVVTPTAASNSPSSTKCATVTPPKSAVAMTTNAATMTMSVTTTAAIGNVSAVAEERPAKPSYAQMAQRARERFEKMAQEQRERQETADKDPRRKTDPAALAAANKHNVATGLPSKDNRPPRDTSKPMPREKFTPIDQRERFRRPPRAQKENEFREDRRREPWAKSPK